MPVRLKADASRVGLAWPRPGRTLNIITGLHETVEM